MNKKEQAAFDALKTELAIAKAFCFKEYAPVKIDTEAAIQGLECTDVVVAWCANHYQGSVSQGCFSYVYHSTHSTTKTSTQTRGGPWYETKREALMAVRLVKQQEYAKSLALLDMQIESEAA